MKAMKFWDKMRIVKIFLQVVRNPYRTELIFNGVSIVAKYPDHEPLKTLMKQILTHENFRQMYEEHYIPQSPVIESLGRLPENSFGYKLYKHMTDHKLDFSLFPKSESAQPIHYFTTRVYQDHDLWHVILGKGVEVEDELFIQAFGVGQFNTPVGTLLVAGGLIYLMRKDPLRAVKALALVSEGFLLGRRAKFLLGIKIHELFARTLEEVRQICGIDLPEPIRNDKNLIHQPSFL